MPLTLALVTTLCVLLAAAVPNVVTQQPTELVAIFHCFFPMIVCDEAVPTNGVYPLTMYPNISGFSYDVWTNVSSIANVTPTSYWVSRDFLDWGQFLQSNRGIGISAFPQTDFHTQYFTNTNPYYNTHVRAAVAPEEQISPYRAITGTFATPDIWSMTLFWIFLALIISHLIWACEALTNINTKQFRRPYSEGIWDGFWWAAVTSATIGYGDKVPKSSYGKCNAFVWMLFSFFFSYAFSATLTSLMTIQQLTIPPVSLQDLTGRNIGIIKYHPAFDLVLSMNGNITLFDYVQDAISSLLNNSVDFVLADQAWLHIINGTSSLIALNGPSFMSLQYTFSITNGVNGDIVNALNSAIIEWKYANLTSYLQLVEEHVSPRYATIDNNTLSMGKISTIVWASLIIGIVVVVLIVGAVTGTVHKPTIKKGPQKKKQQK